MNLGRMVARFRGNEEFHVDFIGRRKVWFLFSAALVTVSLLGLLVLKLNLGIDFRGGALLEYENDAGLSSQDVQEEMGRLGREGAVVQLVDDGEQISVRTESLGDERTEILTGLAEQAGVSPAAISITDVGPKWGEQISRKALQGLLVFLVVVMIYISLRFEWKMAIGGGVALIHDLIITAGFYALVGREVTPETLIAILTILGYSLYDTVVIFDKMKENTESTALLAREGYGGAVNLSLNQVLMRSVNTSLSSLVPIGALMFFGGETLQDFAYALFVGVAIGAYSSVFLAAPLVAVLKAREARFAQYRARSERRAERGLEPSGGDRDLEPASTPPIGIPAGTPRARKPKKKPRAKRKKR